MTTSQSGLGAYPVVAFVGVTDPTRARAFYGDRLGLKLVEEQLPFALVYDAHGTTLRVSIVREVPPAQYTVLGWEVPDIVAAVKELSGAGVHLERFEGMMAQDELGIWTAPNGTRVAWFKDPDGNILSVSQQ